MGDSQSASTPRSGRWLEPGCDSWQVADSVAVGVGEGPRIDLEHDSRPPPRSARRRLCSVHRSKDARWEPAGTVYPAASTKAPGGGAPTAGILPAVPDPDGADELARSSGPAPFRRTAQLECRRAGKHEREPLGGGQRLEDHRSARPTESVSSASCSGSVPSARSTIGSGTRTPRGSSRRESRERSLFRGTGATPLSTSHRGSRPRRRRCS